MSQKKISSGVVHEVPGDLEKALTSDPQVSTAWEDIHRSLATSGYVGLSQLKKQKLEAAGSSGAVQALGMENDAPVVGPDAPTANSKMVKLDIGTADWVGQLPVARDTSARTCNFPERRFSGLIYKVVARISPTALRSSSVVRSYDRHAP